MLQWSRSFSKLSAATLPQACGAATLSTQRVPTAGRPIGGSAQVGDHNRLPAKQLLGSRRIRVVVADDVPEIIEAIRQTLNSNCEIVCGVADGSALVDSVREWQPDLVITDISMPRMSGLEALRRLRHLGCAPLAIVVSVQEDEDLIKEAIAAGCSGFVLKSRLALDLQPAVLKALAGEQFVSERLRRKDPHAVTSDD